MGYDDKTSRINKMSESRRQQNREAQRRFRHKARAARSRMSAGVNQLQSTNETAYSLGSLPVSTCQAEKSTSYTQEGPQQVSAGWMHPITDVSEFTPSDSSLCIDSLDYFTPAQVDINEDLFKAFDVSDGDMFGSWWNENDNDMNENYFNQTMQLPPSPESSDEARGNGRTPNHFSIAAQQYDKTRGLDDRDKNCHRMSRKCKTLLPQDTTKNERYASHAIALASQHQDLLLTSIPRTRSDHSMRPEKTGSSYKDPWTLDHDAPHKVNQSSTRQQPLQTASRMASELRALYSFGTRVGILPQDHTVVVVLSKLEERFQNLANNSLWR